MLLSLARPSGALESRPQKEKDDPYQRIQARLRREGQPSAQQLLEVRSEAQRELSRAARARQIPATSAAPIPAPIKPGAVVNVGPDGSTFDRNGTTFNDVDSGRVRTILPHPGNPDILYLATAGGGVWKTFDATAAQPHWESITGSVVALGTGSLALDSNSPDSLVLGLGDPFDILMPGLYSSDTGGASWNGPVNLSGCYSGACGVSSSVRDVKFNGANTGVVLAATDLGLFRNTAHGTGAAWTLIEMPTAVPHTPMDCFSLAWVSARTWLLACVDDNPNSIPNSFWGNGYLWRSSDDGASWSAVGLGGATPGRMTLAAAAGDATTPATARVYLLASDQSGFAQLDVYKSSDGGASFSPLGVNAKGVPSNPNGDQPDLNVMHDQAWYNQAIVVDPLDGNTVFVGGNLSLVRSTDGGKSWTVVANWLPFDVTSGGVTFNNLGIPYVHADFHAMAAGTAGAAPVFYAGSDGGIFRSKDVFTAAPGSPATGPGGTVSPTFDDAMNRGLATHLLYTICAGAEDVGGAAVILGGMQDNGSRLRNAAKPTNFDMVTGGDGIGCGLGKAGGTGAFGSLVITTSPGSVNRSVDSGATIGPAVTGLPSAIDQSTNFDMQIARDPNDSTAQTFLTPINAAATASGITAQVFRSTDGAASWADITGTVNGGGPFPKELRGVAAHPSAPGIYLAFSDGRVFVTTNATGASGMTWSMNATAFGQTPISSAAFDPNDATGATVWITSHAGATGKGHVFKITSADTATPIFTDMSASAGANPLPNLPATIVRLDPRDSTSQTIYVGTDIGLYGSTDGGANWLRYGSKMPPVKISDLSIARDGTSLRIATYGRGFWELYPNASVPAAVLSDGDHDGNQVIDGYDLIAEAAALDLDVTSNLYDPKSNLTGTTNAITWDDMLALVAKFGGRP